MNGPRICVLDIETMPAKTEQFSLRDQFTPIERVITPGYVFGFGYMWHGSNRAEWVQAPEVAQRAYDILCEADIVVTWNGDRFDLPHLNTEMAKDNLTWPSTVKSVDVWRTVSRKLALESSKLDYAARIFLGQHKHKTDYSLWKGCMAGDERAIAKMSRYCLQDVRLTDKLYTKFRPLIKNHPNMGLWLSGRCCHVCGSPNVQKRGVEKLLSMEYQRWFCTDCGAWPRSAKGERIEAELRPT